MNADPTRGLNTKTLDQQVSECLQDLYNGKMDAEQQRYASHILAEQLRRLGNMAKALNAAIDRENAGRPRVSA